MIASFKLSTAACAADQLGQRSVPGRNRFVMLDLPGQAHGRDGILHGNRSFACFEALISAPEREGN